MVNLWNLLKGGINYAYNTCYGVVHNPNKYKKSISSIHNILSYSPNECLAYYCWDPSFMNWGDSLNHMLIPLLTRLKPVCTNNILPVRQKYSPIQKWVDKNNVDVHYVVGSILSGVSSNAVVWGPGFLHENVSMSEEPRKICAVRGPLSAEKIDEQFGHTTKTYGDPAVLYSLYYKPNIQKKYKLGIIPHYVDYQYFKNHYKDTDDVKIIDIRSRTNSLVDDVLSCDCIASSSLHGLIISEAYRIPTVWMKWVSDSIDDFKYYDYYTSIRCNREGEVITKDTFADDIISLAELPAHGVDMKKLLDACPFYDKEHAIIKLEKE